MPFDHRPGMKQGDGSVQPGLIFCTLVLASLVLIGCAGPRPSAPTAPAIGSMERLRDAWVNRNGNIGSNVTIRVRRYRVETSTASLDFFLNENDLRNPCEGTAEYRLPIERLISSHIMSETCLRDQAVWELVIDTSK